MSELVFITNSAFDQIQDDGGDSMGQPLPELVLNYEIGKEPTVVDRSDLGGHAVTDYGPLPETKLEYFRRDGCTVAAITANGQVVDEVVSGRFSTDDQYGDAPPVRESVAEERMSDDDLHRIGLRGGRQGPLPQFRLAHRTVGGAVVSEIVAD